MMGRGRSWWSHLAGNDAWPVSTHAGSVLVADTALDGQPARLLAIVPDRGARFPRARDGEVGLAEGWELARLVGEAVGVVDNGEPETATRRAIVAIVDVPSQAYGYQEELLELHVALAAAVDAYATARMHGHPVVALIVGHAISGGFLAHGLQADRIVAVDDPAIQVQAMSKESTARVTLRTVEELDEIAARVPATAYDVRSFAGLGAVDRLLEGIDLDDPAPDQIGAVRRALVDCIAEGRAGSDRTADLSARVDSEPAGKRRSASRLVRERLAQEWDA